MTLKEYGTARMVLSPQDRDHLAALALRDSGNDAAVITALTPTGAQPGECAVTVGGYLGRLGLPSGRSLDIACRFPDMDPVEVLRVALSLPAPLPLADTPSGSAALVPDVIAATFCRHVETLASRGLAKNYTQRMNFGPPYAGKLRPDVHLRRFAGRADRLVTEMKVLTVDTPPNRAILRALLLLRQLPLSRDLQQRLRRLLPVFATVSSSRMTAREVAGVHLTALTARYRPALALAAVVVAGSSLGPWSADLPGNSLMFNMPAAWERYVSARVEQALPEFNVSTGQKFLISDAGHVAVADCLVSTATGIVAVVDAKYKQQEKAPSSDDIYQMVTYCHRLGVPRALLIYPTAGSDRLVNVGDIAIYIAGLGTGDSSGGASFAKRLAAVVAPMPASA